MKDPFTRIFGFAEKNDEEVKQIPVDMIVPNPYQPRTIFDDDKINELCQTIKTHGIIQPIVVRLRNEKYEIIAGERRWRAAIKLGMEKIPSIIKEFNDSQTASIALIENLQRESLTAIEEAKAYQKLIDLHGLTQESLAQRLGKGQSTIANKIRLLHLPPPVQEAMLKRKITERHARALLPLREHEQIDKVLYEVVEKELNVKQTETIVQHFMKKKKKKSDKKLVSFSKDTRLAINTVRQSVDMVIQSGLSIETDENEDDDYYVFTIRIPKK